MMLIFLVLLAVSSPSVGVREILQVEAPPEWSARQASVVYVADCDGDGLRDLLVGVPLAGDSQSGGAYIHSSATGSLLTSLVSPDPRASGFGTLVVEGPRLKEGDSICIVSTTDPAAAIAYRLPSGEVVWRVGKPAWCGPPRVATVNDINGDDVMDVVLAYPISASSSEILGVCGATGRALWTSEHDTQGFGWSIGRLPVGNGDSADAVVVGVPMDDCASDELTGETDCGGVFVVSSRDGRAVSVMRGDVPGARYGLAVTATTDGTWAALSDGRIGRCLTVCSRDGTRLAVITGDSILERRASAHVEAVPDINDDGLWDFAFCDRLDAIGLFSGVGGERIGELTESTDSLGTSRGFGHHFAVDQEGRRIAVLEVSLWFPSILHIYQFE